MKSTVVILGARGSVPVSGKSFLRYGGETTCILVKLAGQTILIDAGTGMLALPSYLEKDENQIAVLLSHAHVDHLLGLPMCPCIFDSAKQFKIYGVERNGKTVKQQVCALLAPPLWPVGPERLPADISFHTLPEKLVLGEVTIEAMEGIHPGGVSLFRLTGNGKSIVIMTDCTLLEERLPELAEFARDCDLLLCDGQYSALEWVSRSHFGHSTWNMAANFGKLCGAKQVRIIHHDPERTDAQLDQAQPELTAIHPNCTFACTQEKILL